MSDTLGDLIDKLTIANIKLWHIEDARREYCSSDDMDEGRGKDFLKKVSNVNKERNGLIDQINASLRVLIDKAVNRDSSFHLSADEILGTGKNKFYKVEDN